MGRVERVASRTEGTSLFEGEAAKSEKQSHPGARHLQVKERVFEREDWIAVQGWFCVFFRQTWSAVTTAEAKDTQTSGTFIATGKSGVAAGYIYIYLSNAEDRCLLYETDASNRN